MADDKAAQALAEKEAGNKFYKQQEYESAIAAYGRAIALDPESECAALCYSNRSAVFQTQKKFAKAERDAEACLAIKPDFVRGYLRLSHAQRKQGKYDDAVKTINDGLKRAPDDAELAKALTTIETARKRTEKKETTTRASGVNQARLQLVQKELGQMAENLNMFQRRHTEVRLQLAKLTREKKLTELTINEMDQLPDDCGTYKAVGKMFLRTSMPETKQALANEVKDAESKITTLNGKKEYLDKTIESRQNELKQLVKSVQPPQ